jgi:hypothetical protein
MEEAQNSFMESFGDMVSVDIPEFEVKSNCPSWATMMCLATRKRPQDLGIGDIDHSWIQYVEYEGERGSLIISRRELSRILTTIGIILCSPTGYMCDMEKFYNTDADCHMECMIIDVVGGEIHLYKEILSKSQLPRLKAKFVLHKERMNLPISFRYPSSECQEVLTLDQKAFDHLMDYGWSVLNKWKYIEEEHDLVDLMGSNPSRRDVALIVSKRIFIDVVPLLRNLTNDLKESYDYMLSNIHDPRYENMPHSGMSIGMPSIILIGDLISCEPWDYENTILFE